MAQELLRDRGVRLTRDENLGPHALIPFTQYLRPDGRQQQVDFQTTIPVVAGKATAILEAGFRFECEVLRTGTVSLTIVGQKQYSEEDDPEEGDVDIALCPNGPKVVAALEGMIMGFEIPADGIKRYFGRD